MSTRVNQTSVSAADSIDRIIQELPFRWRVQGVIFFICGLAFMFDAWNVLLPTYLFPLLARSVWHASNVQLGWLGTIGLIGMSLGSFFWGSLADAVGRKPAFIWTLLLYSVFSILSAAAPNYSFLLTARFITGIGLGGCIPVLYSIVAEFMPRSVRGTMLTATDVWWPVGGTLNGLVAVLLLRFESWRLLLLVMALPGLLSFWAASAIPESPLFLLRCGRQSEARDVVAHLIRRTGGDPSEWNVLQPDVSPIQRSSKLFFRQFSHVWSWNWRITLAVWGILTFNFMLYLGALTWLPSILVSSGYPMYRAYGFTVWVTAAGVMGTLCASGLVERVGRKWIIVVPGILAGLALIIFTLRIGNPNAARFWLLLFGFAIELALPVSYCYAAEVYPTLLRGTGFGWASTASRIGTGAIPVVFGAWLWPRFGLTNTFIAITALVVVANLWLAGVGPETKGRVLE